MPKKEFKTKETFQAQKDIRLVVMAGIEGRAYQVFLTEEEEAWIFSTIHTLHGNRIKVMDDPLNGVIIDTRDGG